MINPIQNPENPVNPVQALLLIGLDPAAGITAEEFAKELGRVPPDHVHHSVRVPVEGGTIDANKLARAFQRSCCNCKFSDAWRCAREKNLPAIACHCDCHRYIFRKAARP